MVTVEFYRGVSGKSPIIKFLKTLNAKQESKVLRQLQYLQEFGLSTAIPNCKKISTEIWELRIIGRDNIRLLCGKFGKSKVIVLDVFFKKQQKTPKLNIKLATQRLTNLDI